MRRASRFALFLALPLTFACGDDGGDDDTTGVTTAPTTSVGDGGSGSDTAPSDSSGGDTTPGTSGGMAGGPTIDSVTWTNPAGCVMNTGGDVMVEIMVSDPDTDAADITLSGMVIGCTGMLDAPMVTLVCPNAGDYNGTITAADPEGNEDDIDITISPCIDGSAP